MRCRHQRWLQRGLRLTFTGRSDVRRACRLPGAISSDPSSAWVRGERVLDQSAQNLENEIDVDRRSTTGSARHLAAAIAAATQRGRMRSLSMHAALKQSAAIHGAVFLTAISVVDIALSPLRWPWYFLLPLLAYAAIVLALPPLRRTAPRLAVGRVSGWPLAAAVALSVAASAGLVVFHSHAHPDVAD